MRKIIILFIVTCLAGAAHAQFNETTPFSTTSLTGKSIQKVYARTSGGGITVTGIGSGEARLEVYVKPNNLLNTASKQEIQSILDEAYELNISTDNNQLSVTAKNKYNNVERKKQLSISYKIFVPQNVSTDLATSGGGINLSNLSGTQQFTTSGGGLTLTKLSGKINGRTSGGGINIADSKDDINLNTSGGGITAERCIGDMVLNTSGGSLRLSDLKGIIKATTSGGGVHANNINGELITHTSGGSIDLDNITASIDASTSGGSLRVSLKEVGKYVKLSSSGGNVNLDMPGNKGLDLDLHASRIRTEGLNNINGTKSDKNINGTYSGGGIPVSVRANGNIDLTLR
jgi:hypothetical protein